MLMDKSVTHIRRFRRCRTFLAPLIATGILSCAHAPPVANQSKDPQATMSVDAKGQCHYSVAGMSNPKVITCGALKHCIDKHIDPASDACPSL